MELREKVKRFLHEEIRPALQMDGGDLELVSVEEGIVKIRFMGACAACPMSMMTFVNFVEERLMLSIPEIQGVEAIDF